MSGRPPTGAELSATYGLLKAWNEAMKAGSQENASFEGMASERGICAWFAYWEPSKSRWWTETPHPFAAWGLSDEAENVRFGWLVPQERKDEAFLVVAPQSDSSREPTGPADDESRDDETRFGPVMGRGAGRRGAGRPVS